MEVITGVMVDMDLLVVTFLIPITAMDKLEDTVATWKTGILEKIYKYLFES